MASRATTCWPTWRRKTSTTTWKRVHEPPLTELGQQQAIILGQRFGEAAATAPPESERMSWVGREHPISALYVSPMLRALQTAQPMSEVLKLKPQV
ncbi:MAG: histidine phosphatase family protein [Anaerolineales bacterium]|nr:histidine phosphatase family protein [Anaerolineales bacterium]